MKPSRSFLFMLMWATVFFACQSSQSDQSTTDTETNDIQAISELLEPADFHARLSSIPDCQLIDVRTPDEVANGQIPNAAMVDFRDSDFREKIGGLDKNKAVMLYCAGGNRSGKAAKMLKEMGFREVYDLKGGYTAWQQAGFEYTQPLKKN